MTVIRRMVPNRLAALVRKPGGKPIAQAIADAETNLDEIRDACIEALDLILEQMSEVAPKLRDGDDHEALHELYRLSNEVVGIAGVFNLGDVGRAAYSLCDLLDRFDTKGEVSAPALLVHMDSLRLLRLGLPDGEVDRILDGLQAVTAKH
ncbi:MAG: hypothetical protein AB1429_02250 [Pseudomonadota bacterium]|jgi:hypothetical protein